MNEAESFGVEDYAEKAETIDDPDKDLRDLVPDAHTDGGVVFTLPEGFQPANSLDEVVGRVYIHDTEDGIEAELQPIEKPSIKMSKKRTVLTLQPANHGGDFAYFAQVNEETGQHDVAYHMSYDEWDAFGQPDVITVAVVPRDILN